MVRLDQRKRRDEVGGVDENSELGRTMAEERRRGPVRWNEHEPG